MHLKNLALGLAAVSMLSAPLSTEAKIFQDEFSFGPVSIDESVGQTAEYLLLDTHFLVKWALMDKCVQNCVKPYFDNRPFTLSSEEYDAIAFGAMHLENVKETVTATDVSVSAQGSVSNTRILERIYHNKKFMQAYVDIMRQYTALNSIIEDDIAEYYRTGNNNPTLARKTLYGKRLPLYRTLQRMEEFWTPGMKLTLAGYEADFYSEPSFNSQVIDVLYAPEILAPLNTVFDENRLCWSQAINAKGQVGYVSHHSKRSSLAQTLIKD